MTLNLILLNIFLFFITISAQLNYTKEKISILEQFMNIQSLAFHFWEKIHI